MAVIVLSSNCSRQAIIALLACIFEITELCAYLVCVFVCVLCVRVRDQKFIISCFGRHVKPLVPPTFAAVYTHHPHWARVLGYRLFSLCVIHKESLCPSSGDINRLMMMMMMTHTYIPSTLYPRRCSRGILDNPPRHVLLKLLSYEEYCRRNKW
jgi:hypothetical protein